MRSSTARNMNGALARAIRRKLGLSQEEFWRSVGTCQSAGSNYESGKIEIPASVQQLLFIKYEIGIAYDPTTKKGANELRAFAARASA